jgi:hypothetical protein
MLILAAPFPVHGDLILDKNLIIDKDLLAVSPEVRILSPDPDSEIQGDEVSLTLALVAPLPPTRYRVWINGRPFGPANGFPLAAPNERSFRNAIPHVVEKGRILQKGTERDDLARELPAEVAALVRSPLYGHFQQLRLTLPLEESDGALLRIAVVAESADGRGGGQIIQLRRPHAELNRGPLRVLAIGIGAYTRLPQLRFAADDARALAAAFQEQAGEGKLYRRAEAKLLTEGEATHSAIQQGLEWLTQDIQPGETLILVLSGHGLKEDNRYYFAPVNLDPEKVRETGLPWTEVLARLQAARAKARSVWVLADCCRAAPGLAADRQATGRDLRRGVEETGNLLICTAAEGDRPSYESETLKHGLFTQAWLEALRGDLLETLGKAWEGCYRRSPHGWLLTFSGLQFILAWRVPEHAEQDGVRQGVEFPLWQTSFLQRQPVFIVVPAATR